MNEKIGRYLTYGENLSSKAEFFKMKKKKIEILKNYMEKNYPFNNHLDLDASLITL